MVWFSIVVHFGVVGSSHNVSDICFRPVEVSGFLPP